MEEYIRRIGSEMAVIAAKAKQTRAGILRPQEDRAEQIERL